MNKTLTIGLIALLLVSGAFATGTHPISPKYAANLHWVLLAEESCPVKVNAFSNKIVLGILGTRADGTTICYVPRNSHRPPVNETKKV